VGQVSYRAGPTGAWEQPITLTSEPNSSAAGIALDPAGDVAVFGTRFSGRGYVTQVTVRPVSATIWTPMVDLSDSAGNSPRGLSVALDPAGNGIAIWARAGHSADNPVLVASFRPAATGVWGATVDLAGPVLDVGQLSVAFDSAGNATAIWVATRAATVDEVVESAYRPFGGAWQPAVAVGSPLRDIPSLSLGFDHAGEALAVWGDSATGVFSSVRAASSGTWSLPVRITEASSGAYGYWADLAIDPTGNAVAVWSVGSSSGGSVQAAVRPAASGTWTPPIDLAGPSSDSYGILASVATDAAGNGLAAWGSSDGVQASDLRANGPLLEDFTVPSSDTARTPVHLRVEPVPWVSPLEGAPQWRFGDGGSATGSAVVHVYDVPGTYTVTVGQTDRSGKRATATATIVVTKPTLANTRRPSIRGLRRIGATLTCTQGSWAGTAPIRYAYAWLRGTARIRGATHDRYVLQSRDSGALVACRVTASNAAGSRRATSKRIRIPPRDNGA